ncbi:MAG: cyclic nucleotide-binding domain-containing protein, partial [Nannocystaceae bacterium]
REFDLLDTLGTSPSAHLEIAKLLEYSVHAANDAIRGVAEENPLKSGMGTTVVALLIHAGHGYLAYVGDSRIYLRRGGVVYQLTDDHSILNELLRQGRVTKENFSNSPFARFKNALARAVGPEPIVDVDTLDFEIFGGDTILMCSDGLYEYTDEEELARLLAEHDAQSISDRLVALANERGGKDNITALVVAVGGEAEEQEGDNPLELLRASPLFAGLTSGQVMRLMAMSMPYAVDEGQPLFDAFEEADGMYVLLDGELTVSYEGEDLMVLERGASFGALALCVGYPHPATAWASQPARVAFISRADFQVRAAKDPSLSLALFQQIAEQASYALQVKTR